MANSAFTLSSSVGTDGKSMRATKFQAGHGFSAGSVIRYVQQTDGVTGNFALAQADGGVTAEAVGIVESVDAAGNEFTVIYGGEINTANFISVNSTLGVTGSDVWFLDPDVLGGLTNTAPTNSGDIIKPILTLVSGSQDDRGLVTNYIGTHIGGENTVSLDSVHPVGEIIAFAGNTSDVPTGWQLCDGSTLDVTGDYATYYSRVGTKYGYQAELEIVDRGHSGFGGKTATQTISSTAIPSYIMDGSYAPSAGTTGTILVDPDVLIGITGGETVGDNTGYPSGLIYANSTFVTASHATADGITYTVNSATVKYVKTPDMRSRTFIGATSDFFGTTGGRRSTGMDGFTAGQIGGAEDAVTTESSDSGSGLHVYTAQAAGQASLRQPFMAAHFIIRTTSTAKAALVDGLNVSLADSGLTDHDTTNANDGDIVLRDGTSNTFKELKIFDSYPSDQTNLENSFQINSENGYISVGHNGGDFPLHVKNATNAEVRVEDTTNSKRGTFKASDSKVELGTDSGTDLEIKGAGVIGITDSLSSTRLHKATTIIDGAVGITGDISSRQGNIFASNGQIYSTAKTYTGDSTFTPDADESNVFIITKTGSGVLTLNSILNDQIGAMYTIILDKSSSGNCDLTLNSNYIFANGIKPNLLRGSSQRLVISAICVAADSFLCTWAEDFS